MKTLAIVLILTAPLYTLAQVLTPISVTGFNLDAIAEATTSAAHTTGAIDGSDYVMYSASYGTVYTTGTGLPNNGLIASGTRTYQLEPYSQDNLLYLTAGQTDSLMLVNPGSFAGVSLLAFATEGAGSLDVTFRFSDNSTVTVNNLSLPDWFGTGNVIISGFDRCNRTSGTPNFQTTQPKMFNVDLPLSCSLRSKQLTTVIVHNTGSNARVCVAAVSGATVPAFSESITPVSCSGGTNGSATLTPAGGFPPYNYTVSTQPQAYTATLSNLPAGVYSYTAQDISACPVNGTFAVSQSLVPQPQLPIAFSASAICAGKQVTLAASGAATYTWNTTSNNNIIVLQPATTDTYIVSGHTAQKCLRTGSLVVTVHDLPQVTFTATPPPLCSSDPFFALSGSPIGGIYSGPGVMGNNYDPSAAGAGTHTVNYNYTDANGCAGSATQAITVFTLDIPSVVTGSAICMNGAAYQVTVSPSGGTFSGAGISPTGIITTTAAGTFPFTYQVTNGPCITSSVSSFVILSLPGVTLSINAKSFCLGGSSGLIKVSPPGGSFSGPGITYPSFFPNVAGLGTHTLAYSYTNTSKCANTASAVVQVNDCTGLSETGGLQVSVYPNPNNGVFAVHTMNDETLYVINPLGQVVKMVNTLANVRQEVQLPFEFAGLFFIRNSSGSVVQKVIVR